MNAIANDYFYDAAIYEPSNDKAAKAEKVAAEVESLFIYELMKEMDNTVDREDSDVLFSDTENTYRQMMNQQLSREMSKSEGLGLRAMILNDLERRGEIGAEE